MRLIRELHVQASVVVGMKRAFISNSRLQRPASCFNIIFSKKHFLRTIIYFPFKNKRHFRWHIFCLGETIKIIRGRFYHYLKWILRKLYSVHRTNLMSNYFFILFHTFLKLPFNEPLTVQKFLILIFLVARSSFMCSDHNLAVVQP